MTNPDDVQHCPACGAPLSAATTEGLCRACLLKRGLEANTLPATEPTSSHWSPPAPEALAPFFPDLEILSLIGRGGMGAVYKARQNSLDRLVALKILPPQLAADPSFTQRFTHEAQSLAKLHHPHIVTIYDFGTRMGQLPAPGGPPESAPPTTLYFFLMEYVDGLSLRQLLNTSKLDPTTALAIIPQICDALQFAHDRGIIHRDIKPENLLLTQDGSIKIADFGLAKITQESGISAPDGLVAGTPQYMSPEQSSAPATVDARSDIYALGVVLYQMLTGELPQEKFEPPSRKLHIDIRLDQIVLRALEKNPELRYQNATEFKTEIETVLTTPAPLQRPPPPQSPPSPPARATPQAPQVQNYEFRTRATLLGLPLVHIAAGLDPATRRPRVAHGIIAIGPFARGVVAIGGFTLGFISIGALSAGAFAFGGLAIGIVTLAGLALGILAPASGLAVGAVYASGGVAIAPQAFGGVAIGTAVSGGVPILLRSPVMYFVLTAILIALSLANKICPPPRSADSTHRTIRQTLTFSVILLLGVATFVLTRPLLPSAVRASLRCRVFQIPFYIVETHIQPRTLSAADMPDPEGVPAIGDSFFSPELVTAKTANIPASLLATLSKDMANPPGLLVDQSHAVDFWPGTDDSWAHGRASRNEPGTTYASGSVGIRSLNGKLQMRIDDLVTCDLSAHRFIQSQIKWHGNAPSPTDARIFLVPFTTSGGDSEYLVIAYTANELPSTTALLNAISRPGPTTHGASQPAPSDPALRIKDTYAQKAFEQAEALQKAGRISQLDLLRAKSARDIAAAELAGDSSQVVKLKYQLAEEELHQTEARFQAGRATSLEVAHARLTRDLAAAATQPASTSPSRR